MPSIPDEDLNDDSNNYYPRSSRRKESNLVPVSEDEDELSNLDDRSLLEKLEDQHQDDKLFIMLKRMKD